MPKRNFIIKKLKQALDPERFAHSLRVEKIAVALARRYGVSVKHASQAALLHDYARKYTRQELLRQASKHKIKIDQVSRFEPKLLHAELGAVLVKKDFSVKSAEVLRAIAKHTIGSPKMTKLEKIIYLADHIEEDRNFSGVKKIRKLALTDMNQAIIASTSNMIHLLLKKKLPIHFGMIQTRNYYLLN